MARRLKPLCILILTTLLVIVSGFCFSDDALAQRGKHSRHARHVPFLPGVYTPVSVSVDPAPSPFRKRLLRGRHFWNAPVKQGQDLEIRAYLDAAGGGSDINGIQLEIDREHLKRAGKKHTTTPPKNAEKGCWYSYDNKNWTTWPSPNQDTYPVTFKYVEGEPYVRVYVRLSGSVGDPGDQLKFIASSETPNGEGAYAVGSATLVDKILFSRLQRHRRNGYGRAHSHLKTRKRPIPK